MSTTAATPHSSTLTPTATPVSGLVHVCACHLYDAECALHAAHQSGVEEWIAAAAAKLHEAVVEYLAALSTETGAHQP